MPIEVAQDAKSLSTKPAQPGHAREPQGAVVKNARRVGLNLLYMVPGETGGLEVYARQLIPRLVDRAFGTRFVAYVNAEAYESVMSEPWSNTAEVRRVSVNGSNRVMRIAAENLVLPFLARKHGIDLLHNLGNSAPLLCKCATVTTIHDVIYKRFPEAHGPVMLWGQKVIIPLAVHRSNLIITDSQKSREEILNGFNIQKDKVVVVPIGCNRPNPEVVADEGALRSKLGLQRLPVVLTVSAARAHKNLGRLLEALAKVSTDPVPILVIPGYPTPHGEELKVKARELGVADRVRFCGWLEQADLEGLYRAARCFVFPSLIEGFGLPVLEAMSRGLPVALSSAPPLPEVAGEAARYFDPYDVADMASAIAELLSDGDEREHLIAAGKARAKEFTWERTAEQTLGVYERALKMSHS